MYPGSDNPPPSYRRLRLRWAWLTLFPYLYLARPTPLLLAAGATVALAGLVLRAVAAGFIRKEESLATEGPYRIIRHPLYVGSFIVGLGFSIAGGRWWLVPLYGLLFLVVYQPTMVAEEARLAELFGGTYRTYRIQVPSVLPRFRSGVGRRAGLGFQPRLYGRNKEWQSAVGGALGFLVLWLKMAWLL